jgi:hypothetical protein
MRLGVLASNSKKLVNSLTHKLTNSKTYKLNLLFPGELHEVGLDELVNLTVHHSRNI